ncbi:MAG: 2-succinyl-5-enolpyruvyl-6-hydroxy-3-cyclohexene-1-carboxylic-acid synthase [Dehalococcoidia bacterium]|nr:2-succinyl-5-enolpyruvyl-6-hydroxy-3-cyclohexene-1-carboxylic-acid synthase [Dehalococcoidia bacterium]
MQAPSAASVTYGLVGAFIDELVRSGVRDFCICPGSRSTPLALTVVRHPGARAWMHFDERSAAYFGLGMARQRRQPVALVCTSGTAAANFLPAVVEAFHNRVPLVVLTADRPHELRDCGAAQTIDQVGLYGSNVRWFIDLAEPAAVPGIEAHLRTVASRAASTARGAPAGPVHVNWPFREPLTPEPGEAPFWSNGREDGRPSIAIATGRRTADPAVVATLAADLADRPRGLVVCGPQDDPALAPVVAEFARRFGYPILADPLSQIRCGTHDRGLVVDSYDAFLRDDGFVSRYVPEVVVRFGAPPTSKALQLYLQRHRGARHVVVDGGGGWNEPTLLATDMIHADPALLCSALASEAAAPAGSSSSEWCDAWIDVGRRARAAIESHLAGIDELFEGRVFAELSTILPGDAVLYAGNSMPVRDLDSFFAGSDHPLRMLANRGVNGIDGVVSSALGAGAAGGGPLVLAIGDLSFYHDSNGLLAARQHGLDATIVLLNNDGGGIFSFLPQAGDPEHFETLFGTPHGLDFRPLVEFYGGSFVRAEDWGSFREAVQSGIREGGLRVIEVRTERARNVVLHRRVWQVVTDALSRQPEPEGVRA